MTFDITRFALVSFGGLVILAAALAARRTVLARRYRDLKARHRDALRTIRDVTTAVDEWADDDTVGAPFVIMKIAERVSSWRTKVMPEAYRRAER